MTAPVLFVPPAAAGDGKVIEGTGAPSNSLGNNGDTYVDTAAGGLLYGPKASGAWPTGVAFGADGRTLTGSGAPSNSLGRNGDSYIDTTAFPPRLYDAKASGAWPGTYTALGGAATLAADGLLTDAQRTPGVDYKLPGESFPQLPIPGSYTTSNITAGVVLLSRYVPSKTVARTRFTWYQSVADATDDAVDFGVYDTAGARVGSMGSTTGQRTSVGRKTLTFPTPIALTRGTVYYLAMALAWTSGTAGAMATAGSFLASCNPFGLDMPDMLFATLPIAGNLPLPATIPTTSAGGLLATSAISTSTALFPLGALL